MKINCENKEYIREGNMITCRIDYVLNLSKDIDGSINPLVLNSICFSKGLDTIIPIVVEGTAKCHPDDEFDELLGKRIAECRAKSKFGKTLCRSIEGIITAISSMESILNNNKEKADIFWRKELAHVDELIEEAYKNVKK